MPSYVRSFNAICNECDKRFEISHRFCAVVNLDIDGFEKEGFTSGELNRIFCPHCSTEFTYEIPMIVFSLSMKFACLCIPNLESIDTARIKEPPHLLLPDNFVFRIVRYQVEAKEKYDITASGCDDRVIEYIKLISFDDSLALPFDERNIVFVSKNGDTYKFNQLDYNNTIIKSYDIEINDGQIPDYIINSNISLSGNKWHKIDRISLKEEIKCQNIKISL